MYDPACEELAELFIDDPPETSRLLKVGYSFSDLELLRRRLAERIQEAIEDWFSELEDEIAAKEQAHGNPDHHP